MTFKIVSVGWQCEHWILQTLQSVEEQTRDDWEIAIVYDRSPDIGDQIIEAWCRNHDSKKWHYHFNSDQRFAVRNQYEAITSLDVEDDDIIVFLDLDGDRLAHPNVLQRLTDYYADDTLLTYGNYEPVPFASTCPPAIPFPPEVIASGDYKGYMTSLGGHCCFNHLRTMKGVVFNNIPLDRFHRNDGSWFTSGTDYIFMVSGLELAGPRHKCIDEVLLKYNNANPFADYLVHPAETSGSINEFLLRPSLSPL